MSFPIYFLLVLLTSIRLGLWANRPEISRLQAFLMACAWGFFCVGLWMLIGE